MEIGRGATKRPGAAASIRVRASLLAALLLLVPGVAFPEDAVYRQAALYPEGPVVIGGALYVAEMGADRVTRIRRDARAQGGFRSETFFSRRGCGPTALAALDRDRLAILCHLGGGVAITDRSGRLLRMIHRSADGVRLDSPNDISADGAGGAFFSNAGQFNPAAPATGRVMRIAPDLTVRTAASGLRYANGVAVDRERSRVLVSEHLAGRVLAFDLKRDFRFKGRPRVVLDREALQAQVALETPFIGPDGLEIAPDGAAFVAIYGAGAFLRINLEGEVTRYDAPAPYVVSLAVWDDVLAVVGSFENRDPPLRGVIELRPYGPERDSR
ncbi:MAG: SMP-30/gluconolactonase/LRE family protein [Pseudomonadota bacterium]